MARLSRVTQSIFGSSAGFQQIAQFGSLAASAPTFTTNIATIQALNNYLVGWFNAVIGENSPAIEDMNALFYLITTQLAYVLQAGIPEWDSGTTYYSGDLVQVSGITYVSLIDTNLNNSPTAATTDWFTPTQNGSLTPAAVPLTMTIPTGDVMSWPTATIATGKTVTVATGARFLSEGFIKLTGTGSIVATGTGVIRSF